MKKALACEKRGVGEGGANHIEPPSAFLHTIPYLSQGIVHIVAIKAKAMFRGYQRRNHNPKGLWYTTSMLQYVMPPTTLDWAAGAGGSNGY